METKRENREYSQKLNGHFMLVDSSKTKKKKGKKQRHVNKTRFAQFYRTIYDKTLWLCAPFLEVSPKQRKAKNIDGKNISRTIHTPQGTCESKGQTRNTYILRYFTKERAQKYQILLECQQKEKEKNMAERSPRFWFRKTCRRRSAICCVLVKTLVYRSKHLKERNRKWIENRKRIKNS